MSKKTIRIISTAFTVVMVLAMLTSTMFAYTPDNVDPTTTGKGVQKVEKIGNNIVGIIQVAGTIIAVGVIMVLGIKYMMGSAEEKASYKKTMIPYIVGAVLIFGASNLAGFLYNYATQDLA